MDPQALNWLLGIVGCFFASTVFSMTETALTSLPMLKVEEYAASNNWFKSSLQSWLKNANRLLTTILVGNTLVNTAAATLGAIFMQTYYPEVSLAILTLIITFMTLILGEIIPKMIGRAYSTSLAPILCRCILILDIALYPITHGLTSGLSALLRLVGLNVQMDRRIRVVDIEAMVALADRQDSVDKDKTKILNSVFQFSKRRVKDIMIPRDRISAISIDKRLPEVLDFVRQENHSRYPVFNGDLDRIVGFLHARDLFGLIRAYGLSEAQPRSLENFNLRTSLRRAFFVPEQALISRVLNEMKTNRIHLAIVKDEWGNVVGLITLEDILGEVFGEIEDEHDEHHAQPVVDLYAQGAEVEGSMSLLDLREKFGVEIEPTESYSTLNGFLQHYASHQQLTPKTVIIWNSYVFSIMSVKDGEVEKVKITEIPETSSGGDS